MKSLQISKSYAKALLKTAESEGRAEAVYRDIQYLNNLATSSAEFHLFLSPFFYTDIDRTELLLIMFGNQLEPLTFEFIKLLEKRRDLRLLPSIPKFFREFYCRLHGIVQAAVRVAYPISEEDVRLFTEKACAMFGPKTEVVATEDPTLLGGFIMETPERIYDCSLSGRLERLKRRMTCVV